MKKSIFRAFAMVLTTVMLLCSVQIATMAAQIPAIPTLTAKNEIIESYEGYINSVTVPAGKNMYTDGYRMMGKLPYTFTKLSEVKYIEIDVYVSSAINNKAISFWVTNKSDAASVRGRAYLPALKAGWNHAVIDVTTLLANGGFKFNNYDEWNSIYFEGKPSSTADVTVAFGNIALTAETPEMAPTPSYTYSVVSTRSVDLKGSENNTTDERFFNWETYSVAFQDMMKNPLDITEGDYIEFDYYSDVDATFKITMGSLHEANGFQFYDNRSKSKSVTVSKGWNHVVLTTDGAFREIDTSTLKSYNPQKVTGFVLQNVTSGYIRLTNVAVTKSDNGGVTNNDKKLNYRDDFAWGAAFHAPSWGPAYNAKNLEQQIEQLAEMGGTIYRVDAVQNYEHLDKTVKLCNAYGIKVMLIVYIPGRTFDPDKYVDLKAIEDRFKYYASRYDGNHGHGKIDYIQIDNELDVKLCSYSGGSGNFKNISDYPEDSLATINEQVKSAIKGVKSTETDIQTIINISWVHYGILKYFYQNGVDWDITGHDWYTDMLVYSKNYKAGDELYELFKKPVLICETNMQMNKYNGSSTYPNYMDSTWWDPLVGMLESYYSKDYVIGCVLYEFYDELVHQSGSAWGGEAHFGLMETNSDGTFKQAKPIYNRCKYMFDGKDVTRLNWNTVNSKYSIYADYDMVDLIKTKNILLNGSGYNSKIDEDLSLNIEPMDYVNIKKKLFAEF